MNLKINEFNTDLEYAAKDSLFTNFYSNFFTGIKTIKFVEDLETQKKGIDKIITFNNGHIITIDEKKRRKDYNDILIEIYKNKGLKRKGWLYYTEADFIAYGMEDTKRVFLINTLRLQELYYMNEEKWLSYKPLYSYNPGYVTENRAISIKELKYCIIAVFEEL
jgi:hypothetical protein